MFYSLYGLAISFSIIRSPPHDLDHVGDVGGSAEPWGLPNGVFPNVFFATEAWEEGGFQISFLLFFPNVFFCRSAAIYHKLYSGIFMQS